MKKLLFLLMLIPILSIGQSKIRNTQLTSGSQQKGQTLSSDGATNVVWKTIITDSINNGVTDRAPSQNAVFDALELKEPLLPPTPTNPEQKFLNGNKLWAVIPSVGGGGYPNNVYFTTVDSDVSGYKTLNYTPEISSTEITATLTNQEVLARSYIYPAQIATEIMDAGTWIANFRIKVSGTQGVSQARLDMLLRHLDNSETLLWSAYSDELDNTTYQTIRKETTQQSFFPATTDRLVAKVYFKTTAANAITFYTIIGDGDGSYFSTPLKPRHDTGLRAWNADPNYQHVTPQAQTFGGVKTFTSSPVVPTPTTNYQASTKKYVDDGLATKENTLTKGNLTAGSTKISVNGGTGSVIGSGTSIDVNEGNLTLSNIGGSVTDTQVPNTITLDNITQITNRSHTNLNDIGTNTHTQIDNFIASKAQSGGLASLDSGGKVPFSQLPATLMIYKGTWSPLTNTPTLTDGIGTSGWVYKASLSGTVNFGSGNITFYAGDWVIYNGSIWERSVGTDNVVSVNGLQGVVQINPSLSGNTLSLTGGTATVNIGSATDVAANTSARHSAVTLGTANGLSLSTQQLSLGLSSTSSTGALSSTDWNTFNSKQTAYTNLTSIGSLTNGSGFLKNNGSGTWSYAFPTYSEVGAAPSSGSANYVQVSPTSAQNGNINISGTGSFGGSITATQLQSSIATGTAPLTVNSTTMVNNLNAEYINGIAKYNLVSGEGPSNYMNLSNGNANNIYKAGFYACLNTSNVPTIGDGGLINIPTWISQDTNSRYNFQIFNPIYTSDVYCRSTVIDGTGSWYKFWNSGNLTNPITGTGTAGYLPVWNKDGASLNGTSQIYTDGTIINLLTGSSTKIRIVHGYNGNYIQSNNISETENEPLNFSGLFGAEGIFNFIGNVTATSLIKSGGTSAQFLKADGSIDTNAYLTGITSSQVTTALGYTPVQSVFGRTGAITATSGDYIVSQVTGAAGTGLANIFTENQTIQKERPMLVVKNTTDATASGMVVRNSGGSDLVEFGYNTATNEAYVWSSNLGKIKFGVNGEAAAILADGIEIKSNASSSTSARSGFGKYTVKNNIPYFINSSGVETQLSGGSGGTITGVTAGEGLNGGGTSGSITLNLDLGSLTTISNPSLSHYVPITSGSIQSKITINALKNLIGGGSMVYPSAGIPKSTGSAWDTSYGTSGSGTIVALTTSPTFTTPSLGVATATSINGLPLSMDANYSINLGFHTGNAGYNNTGVGSFSLNVVEGDANTGVGSYTLTETTSGYDNTAIGYSAMGTNTTGYLNTAIGFQSLYRNTTGYNNTSIGYAAGSYAVIPSGSDYNNYSSNNSVYIGNQTNSYCSGTTNEIVIGYQASGNGSNTVTIGGTSSTTTYMTPVVVLRSSTSAPTGIEGGVYYNSSTKHFYGYDGTNWNQLDN